ncbi:short-chain fatty acyl-CoA regulator family protein [Novosphingobium sp. HII-3]|uniref:helix-turn-helix domain-containing protein n=1 Tax=Novosphingobium sp. HII-3 TaxID=2075565 RepID=UPI000CDA6523|nr:helix-turn-helix transcriptional regulator [Novosphingobium sp. HII-3]
MAQRRTFAGANLRALRAGRGIRQQDLAATLGISASYLSQLESDDRALTPALIDRLRNLFPAEWQDIPYDRTAELYRALEEALSSSASGALYSSAQLHKIVDQFPEFARRFIDLNGQHQANLQRLEMLDEALGSGSIAGGRLPWEEVRDWFHNTNNYIDVLDRKAEELSLQLAGNDATPSTNQMAGWLQGRGTTLRFAQTGPLRSFDETTRTLMINTARSHESSRFQISWHIASIAFQDDISAICDAADFRSQTAKHLLSVGLGNYTAGAILMSYERFRRAARQVRHDVDQLRHLFSSSFEQVCHRLSTLQRPGARGTPMYFCRVDMAGNITKRHSATRMRFARFGGACPLWLVHEAVAMSDRIHVQLAEMPDGVRYVSIAKGLIKHTASYSEHPRRYAVTLGCEADFAQDFVYADRLNLNSPHASTPIGESCRICNRTNCDQRAYPPSDMEIMVDLSTREIVPYQLKQR